MRHQKIFDISSLKPTKNMTKKSYSLLKFLSAFFIGCFIISLSYIAIPLFAAYPATQYAPGETLNPACAPTDENCSVLSSWTASSTNTLLGVAGNVGVGTTSPTYKLDVVGSINFTQNLYQNGNPVILWGTTSANAWMATKDFFSTTSAEALLATKNFATSSFSTTSADYWKTQRDLFSTTSADAWKNANNFYSTTSADVWLATKNTWSTTSAVAWLGTKTTSDIAEGSNLYYTANRFAGALAATTTDAIREGSTNLYFTNARTDARIVNLLAGTTTDALAQGATNKYYSDSLVSTFLGTYDKGYFYSTTSANAWLLTKNTWSTTSADVWGSSKNYSTSSFSTTSADVWLATKDLGASAGNWGTTSSDFWKANRDFYSTTSADAWLTTKNLGAGNWGTTTSDFWLSQRTTDTLAQGSTNKYYSDSLVNTLLNTYDKGYFFSTTSAEAWKTQTNFFSTTSADVWGTGKGYVTSSFSTTSADAWKAQRDFFSTTSANYLLTTKSTTDLAEGTNLYYTQNRVAGVIAGTTTDALAQGSTNKYYSNTLVGSYLNTLDKGYFFSTTSAETWFQTKNINTDPSTWATSSSDSWIAQRNTDYLAQGSVNKYYTDSLARAAISSSATGLTYTSGTGALSLTSGYNIPLTASTTEWANKVSSQWTTNGSNINYAGGNVGIGVASPANALDVSGNFRIAGNIMPEMTGASGTVSTRNIGDTNNRFANVWADEVHVGASSLYVNGKKVISDVSDVMSFTTNVDQSMAVKALGTGNLTLQTDQGTLWLTSNQGIQASGKGGITMTVPADNASQNINLTNNSLSGNINLNATGVNSNVQLYSPNHISLTATTTDVIGNLNVSGNITTQSGLCFGSDCKTAWSQIIPSNLWATTSSDYWKTQRDFYSTTSSNAWFATLDKGTMYSTTSADAWLSTKTTDNLAVGSTNKYYTDALARAAISSSATGLTYTSGTGALSLTSGYNIPLTASTTEWANKVSSQWTTNGSNLNYTTGGFTVGTTTNGALVDIQSTTTAAGTQDVFRVGTTTNVNAFVVDTTGNVGIGTNAPTTPLYVNGNTKITGVLTVEGSSTSTFNGLLSLTKVATSSFAGGVNLTAGCFAINGVCQGNDGTFSTTSADYWKTQNNFYSTTSADAWLATKSTSNLSEGTNLYYTANRVAGVIAGTTTDALAQGSTNKYYADSLVNTLMDTYNKGYFFSTTSADVWGAGKGYVTSSFSTTSATYWKTQTDMYSTTSTNAWFATLDKGTMFSTTSADVWGSSKGYVTSSFSTTSADYWKTQRDMYSTTSANAWFAALDKGTMYSTTSADNWLTTKTTANLAENTNLYYTNTRVQTYLDTLSKGYYFSTTSTAYWKTQTDMYSTTSAYAWLATKGLGGTADNTAWTGANWTSTTAAPSQSAVQTALSNVGVNTLASSLSSADSGKIVQAYYGGTAGNDSYTKLLLHLDGNVTDSSASANTVTNVSSLVTYDTTSGKFSNYGVFSGSGAYLTVPNSTDFAFGAGDFTIDFWVKATAVGQANNTVLFEKANNASEVSPVLIYQAVGTYNVKMHMTSVGAWDLGTAITVGTLTQNTWNHIEIVRSGSNVYAFLDGVLGSTTNIGSASMYSASTPLLIGGGNSASTYLTGQIDEFRISKGVARNTTTFTPPTSAYSSAAADYRLSSVKVSDLLLASNAWATTSSDAWLNTYNKGYFFATTSADVWGAGKGYVTSSFSTTSAAYWKSVTDMYSTTSANAWLTTKTTDNLSVGSTNLYYTNALARAAFSSTATGLTYTSGTGVYSLTSGYEIPKTASTTEWAANNSKVSSQWTTNGGSIQFASTTGKVAIGTTTFDTANPERLKVDAGITTSVNAVGVTGSINDYLQYNIQNFSAAAKAQAGYAATANNGTQTTNFAWMGINNSAFYNPQTYNVGGANDVNFFGAGNDMYLVNNNATKSMFFLTGGSSTSTNNRMTISSGGNVGIGTTTPQALLSVAGNINSSGVMNVYGAGTSTFASLLSVTANATSSFAKGINISGGCFAVNGTCVGGAAGASQWTTTGSDIYYTTGKVGIGTNAPTAKFEVSSVNGGGATGIGLVQAANNSNAALSYVPIDFSVPTTGMVGQFLATADNYSNAAINLPANSLALLAEASAGTLSLISGGASGDMRFTTGGYDLASERMRITSAGNIGIGTTTPQALLSVGGNINSSGVLNIYGNATSTFAKGINLAAGCFAVNGTCIGGGAGGSSQWTTATNDIYFATGNVGIGSTINAGQALTVFGSSTLSSTTAPYKAGYFSTDNTLLSSLDGGTYLGKTKISEDNFTENGFANNWTQVENYWLTWKDVAVSSDGLYQTAVAQSDAIYTSGGSSSDYGSSDYGSSDYGSSWTKNTSAPTMADWKGVAMSANGKIQTAVANGDNIYVSYDYGHTWTAKDSSRAWSAIAMSSDGKIQSATVSSGYVYVSTDFGNTWAQKGSSLYWSGISMSSDGKYQTAVVNGGYIYLSSNYGNTWATDSANSANWVAVSMSDDAKYQTAVTDTYIYTSSNYGINWAINNSTNGSVYNSIKMSASGKVQVATYSWYGSGWIMVSANYGASWVQRGDLSGMGMGKGWNNVALSSDGRVMVGVTSDGIYTSFSDTILRGGNLVVNHNLGVGSSSPMYPISLASGAYVDAGGTWTNASSRDLKENFTELDANDILSKINKLDITQWNYKLESDSKVHIGPIAEDFYDLFKLGGTNKAISSIDPSGVALVGIQALTKRIVILESMLASTTLSTTTLDFNSQSWTDIVINTLEKIGIKIADGVTNIASLVVNKFTIGSSDKPTGITMYGDDNKAYCMKVIGGVATTTPGECSTQAIHNDPGVSESNNHIQVGTTSITTGVSNEPASTTKTIIETGTSTTTTGTTPEETDATKEAVTPIIGVPAVDSVVSTTEVITPSESTSVEPVAPAETPAELAPTPTETPVEPTVQ